MVENLFDVEELNQRIEAYRYGRQNMKDRPSPNFSLDSLRQAITVHNQKQNAVQTLVLFRALPFILDNIENEGGIPEDNEHLQMLLLSRVPCPGYKALLLLLEFQEMLFRITEDFLRIFTGTGILSFLKFLPSTNFTNFSMVLMILKP